MMSLLRGCVCVVLIICFVDLAVATSANKHKRDEFCPFKVKAYMGCYSDTDGSSSFTPYDASDPTISPVSAAECACKCGNQRYQYSALTNLNECHCSDNYVNTTTVSTGCINACVDNTTDLCGGFDDGDNSVYSVYKTTVGCDPACNENQTCTLYDNAYYMCTPGCEFSANFVYDVPCGPTAPVLLNITSNTNHGTNFSYSLNGAAAISAPYNVPIPFTFSTATLYSFNITNHFGCVLIKNLTLPPASIPSVNQPPTLTFDAASMTLDVNYYHLLYPSETGNVVLKHYGMDYRYRCPNAANYIADWVTLNNSDITQESISIPFQYALSYDVRIHSQNCVGESPISDIATSVAPSSPYLPTIVSATPQNVPTTGGTITISGIYFTAQPTIYYDGVQVTPASVGTDQATLQILPGQGIHAITVLSYANYSCQEVLSSPFSWSYAAPSVSSTSVLSNAGGVLTITGNNFGLFTATNVSATIDGTPCGSCSVTTAHTGITCNQCPPGTGADHSLQVSVAGLTSDVFDFTYAICDPLCIYGECVGNNQCQCDDGYGGGDCSLLQICSATQPNTAYLGDTCGDCGNSGVCCQFTSNM